MKNKMVTCSFTLDRDIYNAYKGIIASNGENVKGNLIRHMLSVINYQIPNSETIEAIEEVQRMKEDSSLGKSYTDVDSMMKELLS